MTLPAAWIVPAWDAPRGVRALFTTRAGGVSGGPFCGTPGSFDGMNVGSACGDDPAAVAANRARLAALLPQPPRWLAQVHGAAVVDAEGVGAEPPPADAATAVGRGVVCAVQVADCLPVLLADTRGRGVAAVHAGWRGVARGVIQAAVGALRARIDDPAAELVAWLGPCIGPSRFEVGAEVLEQIQATLPGAPAAFAPGGGGKWLADLPALARMALAQVGVTRSAGGRWCTVSDRARFFSFRRDRVTGRHAALVWLE